MPKTSPMASFLRARRRAALVACTVLVVVVGGLWLRDSALVRVQTVTVTGIEGPHAAAIREALVSAARDMTTLHVREEDLLAATRSFPIVRDVSADADLPRALRVRVNPYEPVAALSTGERRVPVAFDGTILRGTAVTGLPVVRVKALPGGDRLRPGPALRSVRVVVAAPRALRARAERVLVTDRGLTAALREGPRLYFGPAARLKAKWSAAAKVLGDPASAGATYVDLRVPERPAAGGVPPPVEPSTSTSG